MKHTPAPWVLGDETNPLIFADGAYVAQVLMYSDGETGSLRPTAAADARLIASAPEMLAALEAADKWVAMYHDQPGHDAASRAMSAVIRAALARAKGQA